MTEKRFVPIGVEWTDGFVQDHEDDKDLFSINEVCDLLNELQDKSDKKQAHIVLLEGKIHRMRENIKRLEALYHYGGYIGSGDVKKEYYRREKLLRAENDQLKQKLQIYKSDGMETLNDLQKARDNNKKALKSIKKITEENDQLRQAISKIEDEFDKENLRLIREIKWLKEQNQRLSEQKNIYKQDWKHLCLDKDLLDSENEQLRERIKELEKEVNDLSCGEADWLIEEEL